MSFKTSFPAFVSPPPPPHSTPLLSSPLLLSLSAPVKGFHTHVYLSFCYYLLLPVCVFLMGRGQYGLPSFALSHCFFSHRKGLNGSACLISFGLQSLPCGPILVWACFIHHQTHPKRNADMPIAMPWWVGFGLVCSSYQRIITGREEIPCDGLSSWIIVTTTCFYGLCSLFQSSKKIARIS